MATGGRYGWMPLVAVVLAAFSASSVVGQQAGVVVNDVCAGPILAAGTPNFTDMTTTQIVQDVKLWQGIVLLLCFGAFALFIALIHRVIRTCIYYDAHLLDTFFDAGGDVNFGLVACSVVSKWTWPAAFFISVANVIQDGLVGHFWYSAALCIQLYLFAIVAAEIRIKAPGAKTFLQVIRARFGTLAHITLMVFALCLNLLVAGTVMMECVRILAELTQGVSHVELTIVMAFVVGFYTVVGGVGGGLYVAYFGCLTVMAIILVILLQVFLNPLDLGDQPWGTFESISETLACAEPTGVSSPSGWTFISKRAMLDGVVLVLASFGVLFLDQSFWQTSVSAKPNHGVWGFILGGLCFFAVPFCFSYALGLAYWAYVVNTPGGEHLFDELQALNGTATVATAQQFWGVTGSFLMFVVIMVSAITTLHSQILSSSSIVVYDIYQAYIAPFKSLPMPEEKEVSIQMRRAIRNEEYLEYDKRSVVLKHVVVVVITCALIPITLALAASDIDSWWMFCFIGVCVNSCVGPVVLAMTWHRITGAGVVTGSIVGFLCAFASWLIYASTYVGGLQDFRANTGKVYPMILGEAVGLGVGTLLCLIVSVACGGCDKELLEEEEWEKTRNIDNFILPWSVKYAPDIKGQGLTRGRPHFFTVRRIFKCSEICAYIVGVLLAVCTVLVWPALMLLLDNFDEDIFGYWTYMVIILAAVVTAFLAFVPLLWEVIATCRQAYYNRQWARSDTQRLEEEHSERSETPKRVSTPPPAHRPPIHDTNSMSDYDSTMGKRSGYTSGCSTQRERWRTFIQLGD